MVILWTNSIPFQNIEILYDANDHKKELWPLHLQTTLKVKLRLYFIQQQFIKNLLHVETKLVLHEAYSLVERQSLITSENFHCVKAMKDRNMGLRQTFNRIFDRII